MIRRHRCGVHQMAELPDPEHVPGRIRPERLLVAGHAHPASGQRHHPPGEPQAGDVMSDQAQQRPGGRAVVGLDHRDAVVGSAVEAVRVLCRRLDVPHRLAPEGGPRPHRLAVRVEPPDQPVLGQDDEVAAGHPHAVPQLVGEPAQHLHHARLGVGVVEHVQRPVEAPHVGRPVVRREDDELHVVVGEHALGLDRTVRADDDDAVKHVVLVAFPEVLGAPEPLMAAVVAHPVDRPLVELRAQREGEGVQRTEKEPALLVRHDVHVRMLGADPLHRGLTADVRDDLFDLEGRQVDDRHLVVVPERDVHLVVPDPDAAVVHRGRLLVLDEHPRVAGGGGIQPVQQVQLGQ